VAAKYSLDGDIFFLILRSKIRKKMSPSKFNLVRSAVKNLFAQPLSKHILARSAAKALFTQHSSDPRNAFIPLSKSLPREITFGEKVFAACGSRIFF
jgi:hypothetical protein